MLTLFLTHPDERLYHKQLIRDLGLSSSPVLKTVGLAEFLHDSLDAIGNVEAALIYGSVAKNVEDMRSDVDVLVIGDVDLDALNEAVERVTVTPREIAELLALSKLVRLTPR